LFIIFLPKQNLKTNILDLINRLVFFLTVWVYYKKVKKRKETRGEQEKETEKKNTEVAAASAASKKCQQKTRIYTKKKNLTKYKKKEEGNETNCRAVSKRTATDFKNTRANSKTQKEWKYSE